MRIAISGSSGLLGTALAKALVAQNHEVVRLVRHKPSGSNQRRWDLDAGRIAAPGLDDVDAVINLAGAPIAGFRWTKSYQQSIVQSRIAATLTIVTSLHPDGRCQRLLNASAVGFYGNSGPEFVDETSPPGAGFLAKVVQDWETAASHSPVPTAMLRTGQVLATEGGFLAMQAPLFRAGLGGRIGSGRQYLSWVHRDDYVRIATWLLGNEIAGPINVVSPNPVTNAEFTAAFARQLRRPAMMPTPLTALRAVFGRTFVTEALLAGQRVRPQWLVAADWEFAHPNLAEALASLG